MKFIFLFLGSVFFPFQNFAQSYIPKIDIEKQIRNHPDLLNDPQSQQDLIQKAENLINHPIDLNKAKQEELMEIPLISYKDALLIVEHRKLYGDFISLEELCAVNHLDLQQARWIALFTTIEKKIFTHQNSHQNIQTNHYELSLTRIINSKSKATYSYQAFHDMIKLNCNLSKNWQAGINLENDAGEIYAPLSKAVFDFKSFFICYKGYSKVRTLCIGDYRLNYGQGLAMGLGFSPGKGAMVLQAMRFNQGISRFNSYSENGFFRGIAASYDLKFAQLDLFYSFKKRDASYNFEENQIESLIESGYHRTSSEQENKNRVTEQVIGGRLSFQTRKLKGGLMAFSRVLRLENPSENMQYLKWKHELENNLKIFASDFKYQYKNALIASEISVANSKSYAAQLCAVSALHSKLDMVFLARKFAPLYVNPFANGMHEWSNQNENGLYTGLVYQFQKSVSLSVYTDYFFSDWIRYRFPALKWGMDRFGEIKYELRSGLKTALRIRKITGLEFVSDQINDVQKLQYRAQLQFKYSDQIDLYFRWEQNNLIGSASGFSGVFAQDVNWKKKNSEMFLRHCVFYSSQNALPIYVTESELSGVFGLKSFRGNGISTYLIFRQRFNKFIQLALKYSILYEEQNPEIEHELKLQLKIRI